jgi:heme-degrading monooxygenase HmoA
VRASGPGTGSARPPGVRASNCPGFISASVHRSTDGTRVFNYLQWETAEHVAAMQRSSAFQAITRRFAGLIQFEPHGCEVGHVAARPRSA